MKKHYIVKKCILIILVIAALGGATYYEVTSILRKEHARQAELFNKSQEEIKNELNLLKIATITKEPGSYQQNLEDIKNNLARIKELSFVVDENKEYINNLAEYLQVLDTKESTVDEMKKISEEIAKIKDSLASSFKEDDGVEKDKINAAEETIKALRINADEYHDEEILKIAESINQIIDSMSGSAKELSDCIDNCYENRFTEISDELSDKLKGPVEGFASLNTAYEELFQFDKMDALQNL